jgi:hypothetical protein
VDSADLSRLASVSCTACAAVIPADVVDAAPIEAGVRSVSCPSCEETVSVDVGARARAVIAATRQEYDNVASARDATGMWWSR